MEHAATLDLEDFEDSELQDRLERARRQAAGRTSLIGQLFSQVQDVGNRPATEAAAIPHPDRGWLRIRERGIPVPRRRALGRA